MSGFVLGRWKGLGSNSLLVKGLRTGGLGIRVKDYPLPGF